MADASLIPPNGTTMLELARGRLPKAGEMLAAEIRRMILVRGLKPGTPLPSEPEIIEQRGLSRATVREALRLLESEGLIEVKRGPRGGVVVGEPKPAHVARSLALMLTLGAVTWRELFAFRKLVEPSAAAGAAQHASDEQRAELERMAALPLDSDRGFSHHAFHVLVAEASGNGLFALVIAALEQAAGWFSAEEDITNWDLAGAAEAHRRIAAAIAKGDTRRAERMMRAHVEAFEAAAEEQGILDQPLLPPSRWSGAEPGAI
jgi:GntR family transcriptional repressor for pyruvate dehydrogenase complex